MVGAECWDALLNPELLGDTGYRAKRFAGALMLHQLWQAVVSEPRRSVAATRALIRVLCKDPSL